MIGYDWNLSQTVNFRPDRPDVKLSSSSLHCKLLLSRMGVSGGPFQALEMHKDLPQGNEIPTFRVIIFKYQRHQQQPLYTPAVCSRELQTIAIVV